MNLQLVCSCAKYSVYLFVQIITIYNNSIMVNSHFYVISNSRLIRFIAEFKVKSEYYSIYCRFDFVLG